MSIFIFLSCECILIVFFHTIYVDDSTAYIIFLNIFKTNIICALHYIHFMISETDDDVYY